MQPIRFTRDTPLTAPRESQQAYRLSEVVSALTFALDLTEGQPEGHTLRACCIGMRMAGELRLDDATASALFYALLLKDAGCSSNAAALASLFGSDDHTVKRNAKATDWTSLRGGAGYVWRNAAPAARPWDRVRHFARIASGTDGRARELIRLRCERGASIVGQLGFDEETTAAIRCLDEHWDGSGHPEGLRATNIPLSARIALLAQTLEVFLAGGADTAIDIVRSRRATWFDPALVDLVSGWRGDAAWWRALAAHDLSALVETLEPRDTVRTVDDAGLDRIAVAFAEVIDAKSPYTYNHSSGVAEWSLRIGRELGLDSDALHTLQRAALLHDIGKLGVSNRILDKPGRLTPEEFAVVRKHPEWTWAILSRVPAFDTFARDAAQHHERLDGSGYPWGLRADDLGMAARILAAADVYEALSADRPYRPGLPPHTVMEILRSEAPAYDPAVLEALHGCVDRNAPRSPLRGVIG